MNNTGGKEEKEKENEEEEKEQLSYYEIQQKKTEDMIKNYNIGTLKMFISPEILSMTSKDRKKIEKIYYKREYTETPGDIIKKQKDEEMRENQEKQKLQAAAAAAATPAPAGAPPAPLVAPAGAPPALAGAPPALAGAPPVAAAAPAPPLAPPPNIAEKIKPENPINKNNILRGGAFFDSEPDYNDLYRDRDRYGDRERQREKERINAGTTGTSSTATGSESLIKRVSSDAEPFIASLVKFSNAGFPNNTTVKSRVDTFFNIGLFKAFLKRLGEPIKLYNPDNQLVSPSQIDALNIRIEESKSGNKNKVYSEDNKIEGDFITIWYSSDEKKQIIGSVYAFIYYRPTEQEIKQQTELGKKIPQASVLMIKEGDNYKLIGGPIDNRVKTTFPGYSQTTVTSDQYNKYTSEGTVRREIESRYRTVTGQSSLPSSSSARNFIFEPKESQSQTDGSSGDTAKSPINQLKAVIYSRQVSNSQMDSIIQSAKSTSTEVVKVPIPILFNIIKKKIQTGLQIKIDLDDRMKNLLLFIFRILEKQNLLSTISSQRGKGKGEIYEDRDKNLKDKLSATSINVLNSTIIHNIRFILNILFSTKTAFKYRGIDYVIDYVEWNDIFKQLNKILDPYKIAYYIEIELFLEKLEKGKLPIDREGTLFSSCAVKGAQLRNYWKKNFVEQNWSKVGKQLKQSFTISKKPSITDILPGFVKSALQIDGNQLMTPLGAGVNQISLVQYCFLGQEQLVNEFKSIDNSFAGVSWKNNNTWEKRRERLFAAMDICDSDIYCFQNVQCSLGSYNKILSTLPPKEKETLADISRTPQKERIIIHQDVIAKLLEDIEDPLNLVAQIYQRYKDGYSFVYFFEQNYTDNEGNILVPDATKTALGHLTMFKTNKFELKDQFDIRIAHFIRKKKQIFKSNGSDVFDPLFINKSFAVVTYLTFKGGNIKKPSSLPGIIGTPFANTGSNLSATTTSSPLSAFPGLASIPPDAFVKVNDDDEVAEVKKDSIFDTVEDMPDYTEEPEEQTRQQPAEKRGPEKGQQNGGDGSETEWYNRDNNEQSGFFKQYMSSQAQSKTPSKKVEQVPCKKYMSDSYIPGDQMFGIINVKLETRETLKEIKKNFKPTVNPTTPTGSTPQNPDTPINKEILEVLLTAGLIGKFRSRYIYNKSTDENPFFIVGDFNYNIPYGEKIAKGNINKVYNQAPALALLLSRSNSSFITTEYAILGNYKNMINAYIRSIYILTYLYGGRSKNGRLRLIGYTNSETVDKMFGNTYPIDDTGKGVTRSQFIFATGKLSLCPKEEMNKVVNSGSSEGLPAFPNDINPSNSDAIGGVFSIDTAFVKDVETQVNKQISDKKSDSQQKQNDDMKREVIRSNFGYRPGSQGNEEDLTDDLVDNQPQIIPSSTPPPRDQIHTQRGLLSPPQSSAVQQYKSLGGPQVPQLLSAQSSAVQQDKSPDQREQGPQVSPLLSAQSPAVQQEESSEGPQVSSLSSSKVEQIKSAISAINKEASNFKVSTSGKSKEDSTKLVPDVIDITGDKLDKLKNYKYTDSKEETIKESPYKESVILCETGKPDYQYLTDTKMNDWGKEENKTKIYSDHAPVLYKVNNSTDKKCGTTQSGGMERVGDVEEVGQAGGAGPTQIDFVTWNIGMQGKQFQTEDESTKELKTTFTHKFKGGVEETDDIYKQRLINNASAIEAILKQEQGYDYMLLQEAPTTTETSDLFKTVITKKGLNFIQPSYKKDIDALKDASKETPKDAPKDAPKEANVDEDTSGISQFCLVTKDDASDYTNSGIVSLSGKRVIYIGDIAKSIYMTIAYGNGTTKIGKLDLDGYTTIKKDFSHLWFFINEKKNLILVSVHFTVGKFKGKEPKMYQRQEQIYTFLNAIVFAIRQLPKYQNFSILFSGDFNVNMLQPFPSDVQPTFLKCSSVPGQETVIYTSVNNAPSSFGGENQGKYNPTNIDFALFYPTPLTQLLEAATSSPPIISSKDPSAASASPVVTGPISSVENITLPVELEIFDNLPKNYWISGKSSKPTFNPLNRSVSIIGTDYSEAEGKSDKMPLGSATLLYIGNISLINVSYGSGAPPYPTMDNKTRKINYMIQASPGSSVGGGNGLTKTTLSNSVMNSLILATLNGVKEIIIPFIGGDKFYNTLVAVQNSKGITHTKDLHCQLLVKGVEDYYAYVSANNISDTIQNIYFSPYFTQSERDEIDGLQKAIDAFKQKTGNINKPVSIHGGNGNIISKAINDVKIDAIVNAANTELEFGTGISGMLFAGIGSNTQKQANLYKTKELFIKAFNAYIQKKNTPSATSVSPVTITRLLSSAPSAPSKIGASVTTSLVPSPVPGSVVSESLLAPAPVLPPSAKLLGPPGSTVPPVPGFVSSGSAPLGLPELPAPSLPPVLPPSAKLLGPTLPPSLPLPAPAPSAKPPPAPSISEELISRASTGDFISAQDNGININQVFPNRFNLKFDRNGVPYDTALNEILKGKKTTNWMWYVFPSDLESASNTDAFFRMGPKAQGLGPKAQGQKIWKRNTTLEDSTPRIDIYLEIPVLLDRYVRIVKALYESMENIYKNQKETGINHTHKKILFDIFGETDYEKLQSSIQNFYIPLKEKLLEKYKNDTRRRQRYTDINNDYLIPMKQMNKLNIILNGIKDMDLDITEISDDTLLRNLESAPAPTGLRGSSGSNPLTSPITTGPNITRATDKDFVYAQTNGIEDETQIPNNPKGRNFDRDGVPYSDAIREIVKGKKEGHWMWYVFPSDTTVSSTTAIFFRLGPKAQSETSTLGQTTISIQDYLQNETLLQNYVRIVKALYESMENEYNKLTGQKPYNEILFDIIGNIDYPKLQSSIQNFYTPLKERLFEKAINRDTDYIEPMKQMNKLNIILNGIKDTDPDINERSDVTLFTSSLISSIRDPKLAPAPTGLRGPSSGAAAATSLQKNQSKIWPLSQILTFMFSKMNECIFVVNGGSFNPPHNGHIKMFDLAYKQLSIMKQNERKKIYGIMVVAPDWWLGTKKLSSEQKISEKNRIKLCNLACDGYKWSYSKNFNASNMIILDEADNDPITTLIHYFNAPNVIQDIKDYYNYDDTSISFFIHNYLLYLCGSDFFIKSYVAKSDYSIIYVVRQGDENEIKQKKIDIGKADKINKYLQIGIYPTGSSGSSPDEYELSSTKIRERIESLKTVKEGETDWDIKLTTIRSDIENKIGLGVYCFLKSINYLVDGKLYGNLCDDTSKPEVSKVLEDIREVAGIYLQESFRPPPSSKQSFAPVAVSPPITSGYKFLSVPINNDNNAFCYQNSVFQLLFSIDYIRYNAHNYISDDNRIIKNASQVIYQMFINRAFHQTINRQQNQMNLARFKFPQNPDGQQDAQEFLLWIFGALISIPEINSEITYRKATYYFCKNASEDSIKRCNELMQHNSDMSDYENTLKKKGVKLMNPHQITSQERIKIMNIDPSNYQKFGSLFNINDITLEQICICGVSGSNADHTIDEILRYQIDDLPFNTVVGGMKKADIKICGGMHSKEFISIPQSLNYICFNKRLMEGTSITYTFENFKNLKINGTDFSLRGYISHMGEITYEYGQPSAKSGHYIYVSIENNKQVLYNDSQIPTFIHNNNNEYIRRGYIFLYKRIRTEGVVASGGNITKKNNRSSKFNINNKTRKTTTQNNKSPKNKNKKKTQHFKIVRNGNNTRKKSKQ